MKGFNDTKLALILIQYQFQSLVNIFRDYQQMRIDDTHTAPHVCFRNNDDIDNKSKKGTDVGYSHWRCRVESRPVNPGPGKMTLRIT